MTKEELEKYAHENRKRLDAQEVKIGDVVKVLRGQFAGETGVIVGIIVCGRDYADPYYEVDMDCEVPDKYKCRKNTLAPNNVIGGLSAYEFEVIGNRAPMQSTKEIKVGDKVRVSKDAPRIYTPDWVDEMFNLVLKVTKVEDGNAMVVFAERTSYKTVLTAIPTKYLIKVDAEAKEPKFKVGDKVKDISSPHDSGIYKVDDIKKSSDGFLYHIQGLIGKSNVKESDLERYTEPTAPTIKVGDMVIVKPDAPNMCKLVDVFKHIKSVVTKIENGKAALDIDRLGDGGLELFDVPLEYIQKVDAIEWLHNHGWGDLGEFTLMPMSANPIIGFEQSYWQRYEADLAKEIALKVANKYNGPKEAAEYAVSVAKTVVENLKKK